jgi:hypothetical protein
MRAGALAITAVLLTCLAACGTTDVVKVSQSTYQVSAQYDGALSGGWDRAKWEAVQKAKDSCAARHEGYVFISEKRNGTPGFTPLQSTLTFSCGPGVNAGPQSAGVDCKTEMRTDFGLNPIRQKVELYLDPTETFVPFEFASNDSFPTEAERPVIARWAKLRDGCMRRSELAFKMPADANPTQIAYLQQSRAFYTQAAQRESELIVALYQQKLTYGEFAQRRFRITHDAAEAELAFRQAAVDSNQLRQMQGQQLAQQRFASSLIAWSAYMQSVNARQPLSVHADGTVHVQQ